MSASHRMAKIYLAGPDGFTPAGLDWHRGQLVPAVAAAGFEPLSPWAQFGDDFAEVAAMAPGAARIAAYRELNARVGAANASLIQGADGMLAVLDGTDVDSGTAAEIGYAAASGLVVVGLRTDVRSAGDNEGALVNLQVEHFVVASGGSVVTDLAAAFDVLVAAIVARR